MFVTRTVGYCDTASLRRLASARHKLGAHSRHCVDRRDTCGRARCIARAERRRAPL